MIFNFSSDLLLNFFDSLPNIVVLKDEELKYVYVNQLFLRKFDFKLERVLGKTESQLFPKANLGESLSIDKELFKTEHPVQIEIIVPSLLGEPFLFKLQKSLHKEKDGRCFICEFWIDRTEAVKYQRAILESENSLLERNRFIQAITESVADIIFVYNLNEQKNVYLNRFFYTIPGYSMEDYDWVTDEFLKVIIEEKQIDLCYQKLKNRISQSKHGQYFNFEIQFQHKSGEVKWLRGNYLLFTQNPDGTPKEILGSAHDITQQKEIELDLLFSKSRAEEANLTKSGFLSNVSHELRTPLNGVLGYAQILKKDKSLSDEQRRSIEIIERSGIHLLLLINDILDISKIESGRMEISFSTFSLRNSLRDILPTIQLKAENKRIQFICNISEKLPGFVNGDERRIIQIIINLLDNAVKFTKEGRIILSLEWSDGICDFCVEDTGAGIDSKNIQEIFEPFKQIGNPLKKSEGTGLGLAICKNLLELMGSELEVQSKMGKGTKFSFKLNLPKVENTKNNVHDSEKSLKGYIGDRIKVLVVDDSYINRMVLVDFLKFLGFIVFEANNGKEAINLTQKFFPKIIFMDLVMPEMDGYSSVQAIRALPYGNEIKIIALSANLSGGTMENPQTFGFNGFIPKPIFQQSLYGILKQNLNLDWVYEQSNPKIKKTQKFECFNLPPKEVIEEISKFISIGDIGGLSKKLKEIQNSHKEYFEFFDVLLELTESFKIKELYEFNSKYLRKV